MTAGITVWTDRLRQTREQRAGFLAAAQAYSEQPIPPGDFWHGEYRRALAAAELQKAEAATVYLEQCEAVLADLRRHAEPSRTDVA